MLQNSESAIHAPINQDHNLQNIGENEPTPYKRSPAKNWQLQHLNTIRKYNSQSLLNQDSANTAKSSYNPQEDSESGGEEGSVHGLSVIEEQQSVVSGSLPIRERVGHLLPGYMGASYSLEHVKLIQAQIKLDQVLDYLRLQREKTKGETLSNIKRTMQANYQTSFELENLRQILFLRPDFYICTEKRGEQSRNDIIIALPEFIELENRKQQFRKTLFLYLTENDGFGKNKNIKIPLYNFPFTPKDEPEKKQAIVNQIKNGNKNILWFQRTNNTNRLNPFDALKPGNAQKFQQQLMAKIKQNEKRLQEQKQKQKIIAFGSKELLAVFDELPKIYKKREKSSMFKSCIIQDLDKSLNIKEEIITKILEVLLEKYADFFKVIEHKNGQILQIQVKLYNQMRVKIQKMVQSDPGITKSLPKMSVELNDKNRIAQSCPKDLKKVHQKPKIKIKKA